MRFVRFDSVAMQKTTRFIYSLFMLTFATSGFVYAGGQSLPHDGRIRFYMSHTDAYAEITYLDSRGAWQERAEEKITHLFHSRYDRVAAQIDRRLIELADHVQDHFQADTVEIICAYRSPEFNRSLKANGHRVANESFHTKGLALDIHIDEIEESVLRDYLLSLQRGGVGYYGDRLMVHMDFGPVRQWQDGAYRENTNVGIFNLDNPVRLRTDKFNYRSSSQLRLALSGVSEASRMALTLEKFFRGQWRKAADFQTAGGLDAFPLMIPAAEIIARAGALGTYGKFRFVYRNEGRWQNSNEFYVKKR